MAYPDTLRRHRLAHHDGQRPRRARLGRRRHRGRGRHARPAGVDAHPPGRRLQADRRDPAGRHRHRRGAHDHRDAAQARRGRQVRRVLRRGRRRGPAGQPGHHRQHEPGVRLHRRDLPDRRRDRQATCGSPAARRSRSRWSRPTPRSRACGTTRPREPVYSEYLELDLSTVVPSIAGPKRPQDRIELSDAEGVVPQGARTTTSTDGDEHDRTPTVGRGRRGVLPGQRPAIASPTSTRTRTEVAAALAHSAAEGATGRPTKPTDGHPADVRRRSSSTTARW